MVLGFFQHKIGGTRAGTGKSFFGVKNRRFFENNPNGHEFSDIMVGDRGRAFIFKCVADVHT
jgi:hypothetical protein